MYDRPSIRASNMILWKEIIQMRFLQHWGQTMFLIFCDFFHLLRRQVIVFFFIFVVFLMLQNKYKNNNNFIHDVHTPQF